MPASACLLQRDAAALRSVVRVSAFKCRRHPFVCVLQKYYFRVPAFQCQYVRLARVCIYYACVFVDVQAGIFAIVCASEHVCVLAIAVGLVRCQS